ncbi:lysine exporter LysO family protein [Kingella sp. (in: b-proteobacteria)]|uniref:lysine exporter LysO family protein n=1 Tax=Kingella sp. (in: b-proteobacteria) TaxID=2020713 RepID=UPI0026DCB5B4|nr:lysine exporter LysO family protein [Kingella sp. (in: b-proteobacteria)]MDO4658132.1 lysine exporter LysO family protein [Kingella sp. (in: b-proteobacteria)]
MESLKTLALVLTPMFIGFAIRLPKPYLKMLDRLLTGLVYLILLLIGIGLAQVGGLVARLADIALRVVLLFTLLMGCNLAVLCAFDRCVPWQQRRQAEHGAQRGGSMGSIKQVAVVLLGLVIGKLLPPALMPPDFAATGALMLLIFVVGMQLRGGGVALRQVLLNRRGWQTALLFMLSCAVSGCLFAGMQPEISWTQGLAMASGYGWYSLSGIVMTSAYGAEWGSVALLNDLLREFFALVVIPLLMRRFPSAAVGIGGATSLDVTLPVIQQSGGLAVVPMAISFGFIVNIVSPILMVVFSAMK